MKHLGPILALAAIGLFFYSRRAGQSQPGQPQPATGPESVDVNSDLSGYPIHGAPALALTEGGKSNYFADYPSSLIPSLNPSTGTTGTTGPSAGSGSGSSGYPGPFPPNEKQIIEQIQAQIPYLSGVGLAGSHASSGFASDQFKLTDFLNQLASIPVVLVDYIGQSLGFGPPPAKIQVLHVT